MMAAGRGRRKFSHPPLICPSGGNEPDEPYGHAERCPSSPVAGTKSDYIALAEANPNSIGIML